MEIEINLAEWMRQAQSNFNEHCETTIDQDMGYGALLDLKKAIEGGKDLAPAFSEILRISCYLAYEKILQNADDDQPFPDDNREFQQFQNAEEKIALKEKIKRLERDLDLKKISIENLKSALKKALAEKTK